MTDNVNQNEQANTQTDNMFDPQKLLENPTLKDLAVVLVDVVQMNQGQMQSNIVFSSLVNSIVNVLVDKGLTTDEEFEQILVKNIKGVEDQYNNTLKDFENEMNKSETEEDSAESAEGEVQPPVQAEQ